MQRLARFPHFPGNLVRLLGLHDLSTTEAAEIWGLSKQAISAWRRGRSEPSAENVFRISKFFELPPDRLAGAQFSDLLARELADRGRFNRVEDKIRDHRGRARIVPLRPKDQ